MERTLVVRLPGLPSSRTRRPETPSTTQSSFLSTGHSTSMRFCKTQSHSCRSPSVHLSRPPAVPQRRPPILPHSTWEYNRQRRLSQTIWNLNRPQPAEREFQCSYDYLQRRPERQPRAIQNPVYESKSFSRTARSDPATDCDGIQTPATPCNSCLP